jgi:hypothetical protein
MIEALLEMAVPTSCEVLALAVPPLVPSPPPPPLLLLFAGEFEYSLVSESELSHISKT